MPILFGFILGVAFSVLVFIILAFFRAGIEKRIKIVETKIYAAGPKPKGAIYVPDEDEVEDAREAREKIIRSNNERGIDTRLEDLQ